MHGQADVIQRGPQVGLAIRPHTVGRVLQVAVDIEAPSASLRLAKDELRS